jgi:enoyl-CoA hydratase
VTPQAELLSYSRTWIGKVLANGPLAAGLVMEAVDAGLDGGMEEGLRFEAACFGVSAATEDRREGARAFLEKRRPAFTGK